ncbi:MAG: GntR family transcriptional regulator [Caldilineae bacterium]|nr:MAG: GntR family transcriptional regulator [Caldilineae bacterium]
MNEWQLNNSPILQTRGGYVADRLREAILRGQLKPGQKLDQNEIAEHLNVSRSPVREALRTLEAEGLVQVYPHRGAVVAELSAEEVAEISQIRVVLEGMAARLAAPKLDDERIATLQAVLDELNRTTDLDRWVTLNRRFHHTIYRAANRPRLLSLIQNLRNTMAPYIRQYITTAEHIEIARVGHQRILEACIARNPEQLQFETEEHIRVVYKEVIATGQTPQPELF